MLFKVKKRGYFVSSVIFAPALMDFLREIFLFRGRALFIEDDDANVGNTVDKLVIRTSLLLCLTFFFKCPVYEAWTLINSQVNSGF